MSAAETLKAARAAGVSIEVEGDDLLLNAPVRPATALLAELKRSKAEIVSILRRSTVSSTKPAECTEGAETAIVFEERAAIVEDGTGAPRTWAEAFARLDLAKPPKGFDGSRWRTLIDDGGGRPILWHIMKIYHAHGITDFIVCLGYKGYVIKEYFANYFLHMSDVTFDMRDNSMKVHQVNAEPWRVTLVETGEQSQIGGRIKRILPYVGEDGAFCLTYGDGVGDVDVRASIALHQKEKRLATVTATQPPGRFGAIRYAGSRVTGFQEKPTGDGGWINGGFFVLSPKVDSYIEGDQTVWEREPMERLAAAGELSVYFHQGFWHPMDTLRDRRHLEDLWASGHAPWKIW